ncbi:MAG: hemerythrin domain-containing protein [Gammaproteobacteria bacterium]|nr:hemerythrin domain-containing protein [Gammaproteobacteria bacterium]NND61337.1 hypothetical protein [Gammaproteobacteria bacterium]
MATILEQLNQDHGNVSRLLDAMELQLRTLQSGAAFDPALLTRIMRYLTQYQDVYHHPREDLMFACVVLRAPVAANDIETIEAEHRTLATHGRDLHAAASASKPDEPSATLPQLLESYIAGLRDHMRLESSTVFPLARVILADTDWDELDSQFEVARDPLFGPQVEQAYRGILEVLGQQSRK